MYSNPFVIWFSGLPASGKSTMANLLAKSIKEHGMRTQVLDSDDLRKILTPRPKYNHEERLWFYGSLGYIASLLVQNDINVLIAGTAHKRVYREKAMEYIPDMIEVFVQCSLETCIARDKKGIYARGMRKEADNVPGLHEFYEEPKLPLAVVDTEVFSPLESVTKILNRLTDVGAVAGEREVDLVG